MINDLKAILELATGYSVLINPDKSEVSTNNNTIYLNIDIVDTKSNLIKGEMIFTAIEPVDFLRKVENIKDIILSNALKKQFGRIDGLLFWFQPFAWNYDRKILQSAEMPINNITQGVINNG
jgi:hypothetical protein